MTETSPVQGFRVMSGDTPEPFWFDNKPAAEWYINQQSDELRGGLRIVDAPRPDHAGRVVQIEVTAGIEAMPDEVFPDGVPDQWDAGTVMAEIRKARGATAFLSDWNILGDGLDVDVRVLGSHARANLT